MILMSCKLRMRNERTLTNATIAINTTILKYQMLKPVLCLFSTVINLLISRR